MYRYVYVHGGALYGNLKIQKYAVPFEATKAVWIKLNFTREIGTMILSAMTLSNIQHKDTQYKYT